MIPVWKETLIPGSMYDPKTGQRFTITQKIVRQAHQNINKMLERGVPIPLVFEHVGLEAGDPDERRARMAKHCFGHVGASRIGRNGALELRHDVVDPEDLKRLRKCKFVSPKIRQDGWMDSRGHEYEGAVLTHSALTASPVQYWQKPFQLSADDSLYLSFVLSDDEFAALEKSPICPPYTFGRDRNYGIDLSALDPQEAPHMADETEVEETETETEGADAGGMKGHVKALIKALRGRGMTISDKVMTLPELIIAVESNAGGEEMAMEETAEVTPEDPTAAANDATTGAGGPPMVMSTLDANEAKRTRAQRLAKPEREGAAAEIKRLFDAGKMTPEEYRLLSRQNASFEMSFTAELEPAGKWTKVGKKLAEIRARTKPVWDRKANAPVDGIEMSTAPVERPKLGAADAGVQAEYERAKAAAERLSVKTGK